MTQIYNDRKQTERRKLLRSRPTLAEHRLWECLRSKQLREFRFRRQFGVGPYIVDFYCPREKLAIEVDGGYHIVDDIAMNDKDRQANIEALGIRVIRFTNEEVLNGLPDVLKRIEKSLPLTKGELRG